MQLRHKNRPLAGNSNSLQLERDNRHRTGTIRAVAILGLVLSYLCLGLAPVGRAADEPPKAPPKITFEDHVLPIFKARCVRCHAGAEPANQLRLTTRREILRGGK